MASTEKQLEEAGSSNGRYHRRVREERWRVFVKVARQYPDERCRKATNAYGCGIYRPNAARHVPVAEGYVPSHRSRHTLPNGVTDRTRRTLLMSGAFAAEVAAPVFEIGHVAQATLARAEQVQERFNALPLIDVARRKNVPVVTGNLTSHLRFAS